VASLLGLGLAFVAVAVAGALSERTGLPVIPLYVLAGIVVGPSLLGALGPLPVPLVGAVDVPSVPVDDTVVLLAELGIVLLLFFLGLEFSVDRLVAGWRRMTAAGAVDAVVNFPLGVGVGLALGWTVVEALLLGGVVYISSSAIITKSMLDLGWIANDESEPILGILVFEDLVIAVYLALVTPLVVGGGDVGSVAVDLGLAVAVLVVLAVVAYSGERWAERTLRADSGETFVLRALALAVPVAGVALALGVSEAVAAFFVGVAVASTSHVERAERLLAPVRDVFAAVFFLSVGLRTDPAVFLDPLGVATLVALVVLTAPSKVLSGFVGGRVYDLPDRRSLRVGLGMVTRGEFSLVVAAVAVQGTGTVMTETIPALAVGYVLVMSTLGTLLMGSSGRIEARLGLGERA
jgi:CPA2 family monovalent cation:H+ antiporter-2